MNYVEFDMSKPLDFIPIGRIAIDFNPTDMYMPLSESSNFNKYVGGSPANIAVGLARLGCKVGFCGCVSNDQFGDFVVNYFEKEGIDTSHVTRAKNGECIGLTFTEILSKEKSSILMYRDNVADFVWHRKILTKNTLRLQRQLLSAVLLWLNLRQERLALKL